MTFYKKIFCLWAILLLSLTSTLAQSPTKKNAPQWKYIDSLMIQKGLYKTAQKRIDKLLAQAKKQQDHPEYIKAVIYTLKVNKRLDEDDGLPKNVQVLQQKISKTTDPVVKSVLYSLLADLYYQYWWTNNYRIRYRMDKKDSTTIKVWTYDEFRQAHVKACMLSVKEAEKLKKIPVKDFEPILAGDKDNRKYRNSLYELLAYRAIDLLNKMVATSGNKDIKELATDWSKFYAPAPVYAQLKLKSTDAVSFQVLALKLLQNLTRHTLRLGNPEAVAMLDIYRIEMLHAEINHDDKDKYYLAALDRFEKRYNKYKVSTEVIFLRARYYYNQGMKYKKDKDVKPQYRLDLVKAYKIAQKAIKKFDKSQGKLRSQELIKQIKEKHLNAKFEKLVAPRQPFVVSIDYRNVEKLHWRVVKLKTRDLKKIASYGDYNVKEKTKYLLNLPVYRGWVTTLFNPGDYQPHRIEEKVEGLPSGSYMLMASAKAGFPIRANRIIFDKCQVTRIAYIMRDLSNNQREFYTIDRHSGEPIAGVKVRVYQIITDTNNKKTFELYKRYKTDKNGRLLLPGNKLKSGGAYFFKFKQGKDVFSTYNGFNNTFYASQEPVKPTTPDQLRPYFFLDRKIYRPGQTLHFKGVVTLFNHERQKYEVALPHKAKIILVGKGPTKKVLEVDVNEFGSFSGTFKLPGNGLTGTFLLRYWVARPAPVAEGKKPYKYAENQETYWRIRRYNHPAFFRIEEYKRPKFSLSFLPVKGRYYLGQTIAIKGKAKAFSGANTDGAKVKYKITRKAYYASNNQYFPTNTCAQGETTTNAKGVFIIKLNTLSDIDIINEKPPNLTFEVLAEVTDLNGETRSKSYSVEVASQDVVIDADIAETISPELPAVIQLTARNYDKDPVVNEGTVSIYRLKTPKHYHRNRQWEVPDQFNYSKEQWAQFFPNDVYGLPITKEEQWERVETVLQQPYKTDSVLGNMRLVPNLAKWKEGRYMLVMETRGRNQQIIRVKRLFNVQTTTSAQLIVPAASYFVPVKTSGKPGENAQIWLGASTKTWMLLTIEYRGKIVRQFWKLINPGRTLWQIPITPAYYGNFAVKTTFIKHNRWYSHSQEITVPFANKKLDISFETFRNKLLPGEKEKWRIKIKGQNNALVAAEMVATLYDASLDAFAPNKFNFDFYPSFSSRLADWNPVHSFEVHQGMDSFETYHWSPLFFDHYQRSYEDFRWFGYKLSLETEQAIVKQDSLRLTNFNEEILPPPLLQQPEVVEVPDDEMIEEEIEVSLDVEFEEESPPAYFMSTTSTPQLSKINARKNFSETAFFYPHLRSDVEGNVMVEFTVPESLTKWKMQGFAHTKDLKFGMISNSLVTQKQLMVVPNAPRFFREGDELTFQAKITNLAKKNLEGKSQLMLFDALTNTPIEAQLLQSKKTLPFQAKAGQSTVVSWKLKIPVGLQAITYRIVAAAGNFSDGEEMTLPVLTNRKLVTESLSLPVNAGQTKNFDFARLRNSGKSKTLRHHQVTLEFTPNPAWYAVQALPYLMEFPHECAEQTFSRMYANSLATHIVGSNPKIKTMFDAWKNYQPKALLSNLEKNQKLKSTLLSETPWVLQAQSEAGRKRRLGLLFDLQRMSNEQQRVVKKLRKMQLVNGGWGWFEGMKASRYISQHIVSGLAHLKRLGVAVKGTEEMANRGLQYLDFEIMREYAQVRAEAQRQKSTYLKKNVKSPLISAKANRLYKAYLNRNHLTHEAIQYLYTRSFYSEKTLSAKAKVVWFFYAEQARRYWLTKDLQTQGMIALAMHRSGFKTSARSIVASLKKRSVYSEEMGRYWTQTSGYYWYQAPIETQAIMIEVFDEVIQDTKAVEELKTWLLKQKHARDWGTTKATTEACYALLMKGSNWLDDNKITITMGGQEIDSHSENAIAKAEPGSGYFKIRWKADDVHPEMGNIRIQNPGNTPVWGAVYWQYFEQLDKITSAKTSLKLTKTLFLRKNTEAGTVFTPVTAKTKIKVGDLIKVVIRISSDRAMEFVHLKDMRASGLEPLNVLSRYKYQDGLGYYESTRDAATHFFIDYLSKGSYVLEYPLRVTHAGDFSNGISTIQSMYAPEFSSHSEGMRVRVEKK